MTSRTSENAGEERLSRSRGARWHSRKADRSDRTRALRSPFRSSHAIYVCHNAEQVHLAPSEVPEMLRSRLRSVRALGASGMMVGADVIEGRSIEAGIERLLAAPEAVYLHVHFARAGCHAARVHRA
jgi:hypothetical protein